MKTYDRDFEIVWETATQEIKALCDFCLKNIHI